MNEITPDPNSDDWMDAAAAANYIGKSLGFLSALRKIENTELPFYAVNDEKKYNRKRYWYRKKDLDIYLEGKAKYSNIDKEKLKNCLFIHDTFTQTLLTSLIIEGRSIEDTIKILSASYYGCSDISSASIKKYRDRALAGIALFLLRNGEGNDGKILL